MKFILNEDYSKNRGEHNSNFTVEVITYLLKSKPTLVFRTSSVYTCNFRHTEANA